MVLGQKVKFQKELKRNINTATPESIQFALDVDKTKYSKTSKPNVESYKSSEMSAGYISASNYGVHENGKILEGVYCGKRNIDMTGTLDYEEGGYIKRENLEKAKQVVATHTDIIERAGKK